MKLSGARLPSVWALLRLVFFTCFPMITKNLKISLWDKDNLNFFVKAVIQSIESRTGKKINGNESFLDAMLKTGTEKEFKFESKEDARDFIITNAIMLFFVGQDTMSGAMSITSYYLARHPDIQDKLYQEIKDAIDDNNGNVHLDYNALNNLSYLDKVIKESMRLWGVNFFDRKCTKEYHIPEINFTVPKDMHVTISGGKLMNDDKNVPNAATFDPDAHFGDDSSLTGTNYLVFGQGPRSCPGMRIAMIAQKLVWVHVLNNFKVKRSQDSKDGWKWDPAVPGGIGIGSILVNLKKRN